MRYVQSLRLIIFLLLENLAKIVQQKHMESCLYINTSPFTTIVSQAFGELY